MTIKKPALLKLAVAMGAEVTLLKRCWTSAPRAASPPTWETIPVQDIDRGMLKRGVRYRFVDAASLKRT